jgi:hypothetical protein
MNIHQISVNYVPEQDRCLVRINSQGGEELRLWFTRRLVLGLMPHLTRTGGEQMQQHTGTAVLAAPVEQQRQQMLASFQKEADAYKGDYQTPFKAEASALPLGSEPALITEIQLTLLPSGKVDLQLIEKTAAQTRNIKLGMTPQLMQGLLHLLGEAIKKSDWLRVPSPAAELPMVQTQEAASALASEDKPKYLN